jgi:hypothetical protein
MELKKINQNYLILFFSLLLVLMSFLMGIGVNLSYPFLKQIEGFINGPFYFLWVFMDEHFFKYSETVMNLLYFIMIFYFIFLIKLGIWLFKNKHFLFFTLFIAVFLTIHLIAANEFISGLTNFKKHIGFFQKEEFKEISICLRNHSVELFQTEKGKTLFKDGGKTFLNDTMNFRNRL